VNREFLFVLWAGGGNVPPQLAIARRLVARGHHVRMLAPAVLRDSIEAAGIVFEPYGETPEHDESNRNRSIVRDFEARSKLGAVAAARDNLIAGLTRPVALDVTAALERRSADVVAYDFLLFGARFAAERAGVPAAMLIHTIYPFPAPGLPPYGMGWSPLGGPLGALRAAAGRLMFGRIYEAPLLPVLNRVRRELGLGPVRSIDELVAGVDRALVLTSPTFDFPARLPSNVEYVGPQIGDPTASLWAPAWPSDDRRPLVVVGLSTTYLAHDALLDRVVAALADLPVRALVTTGGASLRSAPPPNIHVEQFVPHVDVMPEASPWSPMPGSGPSMSRSPTGCHSSACRSVATSPTTPPASRGTARGCGCRHGARRPRSVGRWSACSSNPPSRRRLSAWPRPSRTSVRRTRPFRLSKRWMSARPASRWCDARRNLPRPSDRIWRPRTDSNRRRRP